MLYWEGGNDLTQFLGDHDPFVLSSPDDRNFPFTEQLADALARTRDNVEAAIVLATGAGMDVYVATYFPLAPDIAVCDALPFGILLPAQGDRANAYVARLNDALREAAARGSAFVVDVAQSGFILTSDPNNYFNCNHLSAAGNEIAAQIFLDVLEPVAQRILSNGE